MWHFNTAFMEDPDPCTAVDHVAFKERRPLMCQISSSRRPIFCILPPHVIDAIAQRGTPSQRARALRTLATDNTLRALRASARPAAPTARQRSAAAIEGQKQRTIFDAHNTQTLPGAVVRSEGAPPGGDIAVNEAYDGLGATYDLFWMEYERNSIDDEGMPMNATVHFDQEYNNAFWNGEQMVFGDGDGELFNRFTISLDVIGHELTHGVTEDEAQLVYFFQPGALNESISDVFGSLVKQRNLNQTAEQADWLIGEGLFTANVHGVALRSMKAPGTAYDDPVLGKDPQPAHMNDFVKTYADNGGVHINSGIPNHAFYLAAIQIGGYAWEKTGRIWYETLRDSQLRTNSGFKRFAGLTSIHAGQLFGTGSAEQQAVSDAWKQVGISTT
jgi:Zn-dependent metalloprotease